MRRHTKILLVSRSRRPFSVALSTSQIAIACSLWRLGRVAGLRWQPGSVLRAARRNLQQKSDNPSTGSGHRAWLTVVYTRDKNPPWPLKGGQPGSPNHILIRRANGETERHAVVSGLTLNTDDVTQVMTATGAGWGDPMEHPLELVRQDLRNGYITLEQANRFYGLDKRSKSG
jgi:hypothetical protein